MTRTNDKSKDPDLATDWQILQRDHGMIRGDDWTEDNLEARKRACITFSMRAMEARDVTVATDALASAVMWHGAGETLRSSGLRASIDFVMNFDDRVDEVPA